MVKKYDMSLRFLNQADQEIEVTTTETGGILIIIKAIEGNSRLYLDKEEINILISMLHKLKNI